MKQRRYDGKTGVLFGVSNGGGRMFIDGGWDVMVRGDGVSEW